MLGIHRCERIGMLASFMATFAVVVGISLALSATASIQHAYAENTSANASSSSPTKLATGESAATETPVESSPAVVEDGLYNIVSSSKKRCSISILDGSAKTSAKAVLATTDTTSWSQKWIVLRDETTGYYTIRNLSSRKVLGISGKVKSGAAIKQIKLAKTPSKKQLWMLLKTKKTITFRSVANPSLAITVSGKVGDSPALKLKPLDGAQTTPTPRKAQKFKLNAVEAIEDGHSFFIRSEKTSQAVSVLKDSRKDKAKLGLEKKSSARNQKFRLFSLGKSTYRIQCVSSCKFVGSKGKAARQYTAKSGKDKKWKIALNLQTGTFTFASVKMSGKQLEAASDKLSLKAASISEEQRFVLVPTYGFKAYLDPGHGRSGGIYDPGAEGSGYDEAPLTKDLIDRIEEHLKGTDIEVVNGGDFDLAYWRRNPKAASLDCDVVLSAHFDADGGSSSSTMIGTSGPLSRSRAFNRIIHKSLISSIGLSDGGTMQRSDITIVNGRVPAVLMEVCFIDDYGSLRKYLSRRDSVAQSLAAGIVKASQDPSVQR